MKNADFQPDPPHWVSGLYPLGTRNPGKQRVQTGVA